MTQQRFDAPALALTLVVVGMAVLVVRWLPAWQPAVADKTAEALVREALMLAPPPARPAAAPVLPSEPPPEVVALPEPEPVSEPVPVVERGEPVAPPPRPVVRPVDKPKPPPKPPAKPVKPAPVAPVTAPTAPPVADSVPALTSPAAVPAPAQQAAEAQASRQREADAMAEYRGLLMALLARHKEYPRLSRRLGEQGEVRVAFEVAADGRVLSVALVQGSGHARLDEATLGIFEVLNRQLPPFLPGMAAASLRFELPVRYALSEP